MTVNERLAAEFHLRPAQVDATVSLIDDGNTIPFIARYRKEVTGSLDDQVLRELAERLDYLRRLTDTREKYREAIAAQGALTDELEKQLDSAATMTDLDDVYRPFRPKRKTRASVAEARGLAPLADALYAQSPGKSAEALAQDFLSDEVPTTEDALQGARDILAQRMADDAALRHRLRTMMGTGAFLCAKKTGDDPGVYAPYADYREPVAKAPGHRILAVNRGEREGLLRVSIDYDRARALSLLSSLHLHGLSPAAPHIRLASEDAYDRLIFPAMEREWRSALTERAEVSAIKVFAVNLRQLLMQPPVRGAVTLALDPGYQHGCKCAVVDDTGKVLATGIIYPVPPHKRLEEARQTVSGWITRFGVTVIAIGNGTASHETEVFTADLLRTLSAEGVTGVAYMVVNEAGASVYSASPLAAKEFPQYDVSLRSAVSIARRLQDPLAELVKIDPQAIGVGQYQHDMPQKELAAALSGVVESCVNTVGVDLNTASVPLLTRVAGITASIAHEIVAFREENGRFTSRAQLKKVPKLGPKAFEQCAGFLRVPDSRQWLDRTAVHPESYKAAEELLRRCAMTAAAASANPGALTEKAGQIGLDVLSEALAVGLPTLNDILAELQRPGRDPRDELPPPLLRTDILKASDLTPGMELRGTVRNVIDFGAFVDVGVHQDGLVHISQITDRFISHPSAVLKVGDIVTVWVLKVDAASGRISLTMKPPKKA